MLETKLVGDKFELLVTDSYIQKVANIMIVSSIRSNCHDHKVINISDVT